MKWKNPPGEWRSRGKATTPDPRYREEAKLLRENPGRWALLESWPLSTPRATPAGFALGVNRGFYISFRPVGDFEARSYTNHQDQAYEVYVRYIGET